MMMYIVQRFSIMPVHPMAEGAWGEIREAVIFMFGLKLEFAAVADYAGL